MRRLTIIVVCMLALASCQLIDRVFKGEVVARVGKSVLYESEVIGLVPKNSTPEDSTHIIEQYIYSWATQQLLLSKAEDKLTKEDRNVDKELADLRRTLLVYRYEKLFVDQRLDTLITEDECEAYYKQYPQSFIASTSIVKARYVKINNSSPNLQSIKALYRSYSEDDTANLKDLCYSSADIFSDFDNAWIPVDIIAKELEEEPSACEKIFDSNNYIEKNYGGFTHLVSISERVRPGEASPYEYCVAKIREIILSKRKQELIAGLERNLLNDAISSKQLHIY